jgi:hypothetical protein
LRIERRDTAMLDDVVDFLSGTPGVVSVRANRACRSIVVRYDERLRMEALLARITGCPVIYPDSGPASLVASQGRARWLQLAQAVAFELVDVPLLHLLRDVVTTVRILAAAWRERGERSWPEIVVRAAVALLCKCSVVDVLLPTPLSWLLRLVHAASSVLQILSGVAKGDGTVLLPRAIGIARVALAA